MDIYCYEQAGGWAVAGAGEVQRFSTRADAFAAARSLLRAHAPGRLVREPPPPIPDLAIADDTAPRTENEAPLSLIPDWERLKGPAALGRSLLIEPGGAVPPPWSACDRVVVPVADRGSLLESVRRAFNAREPTVYEIEPGESEIHDAGGAVGRGAVWQVPVSFEFGAETLEQLMRSNAVDARDPANPVFAPLRQAMALGAEPATAGAGDIVLPDGRHAFCDGGPLGLARAGVDAPIVPGVSLEHGYLEPLRAGTPEADLAPDQLEAVGDQGACSRIIAPAGSGKTRVLTERARFLLSTAGVPPEAMTLIAFNKRAQEEMRARTRDLPQLQVQTLNAMALAILNGTAGFRRRGERVATIDEAQVRDLLSRMIKFPRRANTDPAAAWIDALSAVRLGLQDPKAVEDAFEGDVDGLATFFPKYRDELRRRGVVDFDEQIYRAVEVLLTEPETRRDAQRRCRLLLVDEFQDLTPAHLLLIRLLAAPEFNVFGVGDDDQTIYGYSGASPDWLIAFDTYFPGATHHALTVNYRCPEPVVRAATNLLSYNRRRVPKEVHVGPKNRTGPDTLVIETVDEPARSTVDLVASIIAQGARPQDVAVLARVNTLLAPIQVGLFLEGIPVFNLDGARFLERTGVAAALSWLRLASTSGRLGAADVQRAARRPSRGLSPKVIEWMAEQKDIDGLERLAHRLSSDRDTDKVLDFAHGVGRIRQLATAKSATTKRILELVRTDMGLEHSMQTLDHAHQGRNTAAHSDDLRALIALAAFHPDASTFGKWLRDSLSQGHDGAGVTLSTVHRVKGLEWPHVIVHDVSEKIFPHRLSLDLEEERRVFHVAITRGQQSVTVMADEQQPSTFLAELFGRTSRRAPPESPAARSRAGAAMPATAVANPDLLAALKAWRRERATADAVPAYVVAGDKTLALIAARTPRSAKELLGVDGIGPVKLDRYGEDILGIVSRHASEA
ncbi:MAG: ATP-dependent DNA helicase UvrD2 [Actinobacteria bacterium]|nr:ATP-dependent DNA helicase UvrD2 [Actinomycetota bacterium]